MKKKITFLLTAFSFVTMSLHFFSCQNEDENASMTNGEGTLPKYPQTPISVISGVDGPFANYLGNNNKENASYYLRDSIWSSGGRSQIWETDELAVLESWKSFIYPGSLFKGGSFENNRPERLSYPIDPIVISASFPGRYVSSNIEQPTLSTTRTAIQQILRQNGMSGQQIASFSYDISQFSYYDELKLAFGSNVSIGNILNLGVDVSRNKIEKRTGLIAKFVQKNFTIDVDMPWEGTLLKNESDLSRITGYCPVYVSSVTYGRMGIISMESDYNYDEVKVAVNLALKVGIVGANVNLTTEQKEILDKAKMKAYIVGADGLATAEVILGFEKFRELIIKGGYFSPEQPGEPIYFSTSYLTDNSPFYSKFKIDIPNQ